MSGSRIAAARARAASAKAALLVSALLAFGAALLLAAWTRPVSKSARKSVVVRSSVGSQASDFSGQSEDDFSSGSIAPAQSAPQVATSSS